MRKMPAHFSTSTISPGIRRDVSISNARAVMAGRNSWIVLSRNFAVSDKGEMPEEACLGLGERKRLLMIVPCSLMFARDLWTKRHRLRKDHDATTGFGPPFGLPSDRSRKELPKRVAVRRMEKCHRFLRLGLPIDRARMTERAESRFAPVGPHVGCADPTVWHILHKHVRHDVVDGYAARSRAVEHFACLLIVGSEVIKSQWTWAGSDRFQRIVNAAITEYRQDRTKNFVAHYRRIARRIENQDRHHATRARRSGKLEDVQYFGTSGVSIRHQPLQSCEMRVIYD